MENMRKKNKWRKFLLLTGTYAVLSLVFSYVALTYLNANIFIKEDPSSSISNVAQATPVPVPASASAPAPLSSAKADKQGTVIGGVPASPDNLMFSYDNQYCMYIYDNKIYVKEIKSDKLRRIIQEKSASIANAVLMNDRNRIIYFTISPSGSIKVKTYNIETDEIMQYLSFKVASGSSVKGTDYSSLTNLIYINVMHETNGRETDNVYRININKRLKKVATGAIVDNMTLLGGTDDIYYRNESGELCHNAAKVKSVAGKKVVLLGKDSKDNIYVQSFSDNKTIYVLNQDAVVNTISLDNPDYNGIVADRKNIYAVYNGYVIDITGDPAVKMPYDGKTGFLGIVGSKAYLRDKAGMIIQSDSGALSQSN